MTKSLFAPLAQTNITGSATSSLIEHPSLPKGCELLRLTLGVLALFLPALFLLLCCFPVEAQKAAWRQATDAELAALLPARAPVEKEHIETEMRTASGITNGKGQYIAGVVIITAGYSADGKYSHYLVVQTPMKLGSVSLAPGEYVFGFQSMSNGEALSVHLYEALTGRAVGVVEGHRIAAGTRVESLRIWPPGEKQVIQIGRFAIAYELGEG